MRLFIIVIFVATLVGCSNNLGYIDNKVYSEDILPNYKENYENDIEDYIDREEAINRAIELFKTGFDVEIDRQSIYEFVNLYYEDSVPYWNIRFTQNNDKNEKIQYFILVNSNSGEIKEARIYNCSYFENYNEEKMKKDMTTELEEEEIKMIIKPLCDYLGINIDGYSIGIGNSLGEYDVFIHEGETIYYQFYIKAEDRTVTAFFKMEE